MSDTPFYIHNLSSIAFQVGSFIMPWYWLVYLLGYFWVYLWMENFSKKGLITIGPQDIYRYMTLGFISMMLGARLTYIFLYNFRYYEADPKKIFYLWEGGMSFHGAVVGAVLGIFWIARRYKQSLIQVTDSIAMTVPFVLGLGRLANFMNGELAGRVTNVSWAVIFPKFYDMAPRHPSQLYQAATEGFLLFIIAFLFKSKLKRRGFHSSLFLIGYGSFRFLTEYFRMPDKQLGLYPLGLSMGQILCLIMIISGVSLYRLTKVKD